MGYVLYEVPPTRAQRCVWTLKELDIEYESVSGRELLGSDRLKAIHPQGKVPALTVDGKPLFESAAICTFLADAHPEKGLIPKTGTYERGLHEQWVAFTLSEMEAHLWTMARNTFIYPESEHVAAIFPQMKKEAGNGLRVFEDNLEKNDFLLGDAFQVTDIVAGFALNWARRTGLTKDSPAVTAYLNRLFARPLCPLNQE